jgi:hypothetical protein
MAALFASLLAITQAHGAPHTFTPQDYIEYGIYFAESGRSSAKAVKLLDIRFGNLEDYYRNLLPRGAAVPSRLQILKLRTKVGSVIVNRKDNLGLSITRDSWNETKRSGTKRLEVRFENATCTDANGVSSPCIADLLLTTDKPDLNHGVIREPRTLVITTSTGLQFRYRSARIDGTKPFNLPRLRRFPVITNYAFEKILRVD